MADSIASILLAGGRSVRMGKPKALLEVAGHTLMARSLSTLESLSWPIVIALRADQDAPSGYEVLRDLPGATGPLAGIVPALNHLEARFAWAFVLAVDMPLLVAQFAHALFSHRSTAGGRTAEAVVARVDGHDHVLCAFFRTHLTKELQASLMRGEQSLVRVCHRLETRYVSKAELLADEALRIVDPELRSLTNVNTPVDVDMVSELLQARPECGPRQR